MGDIIYKVCVYAICKNEENNVLKWYDSVSEADNIYVLDTGSTDNSVKLLKSLGVIVKEVVFDNWRFDVARNMALQMVPNDTDICVSIDIDERFDKGWRKIVEDAWNKDTDRIRYMYYWKLDGDKPIVSFYLDKIHSRNNYFWKHPVHEVLFFDGDNENIITCDNIILRHFPDCNKSRGSYLNLLELSVIEDPDDDRNMHYLGREYMYYGKYKDAIKTLKKHLKLKSAVWDLERAASCRFIGRCYYNLGNYRLAKKWYLCGINEAPNIRDCYVELAILEYNYKNYNDAISNLFKALSIKNREYVYINEVFSWDYTIDNLLSVIFFELGLYDIALFFSERCLKYDENNKLLINNYNIIKEKTNF